MPISSDFGAGQTKKEKSGLTFKMNLIDPQFKVLNKNISSSIDKLGSQTDLAKHVVYNSKAEK